MTITDQMVEAALQAYCGQDHQLDFGVLPDHLKAMRAAIEAAEAAAPPNARDATIAALRAEVKRLRTALYAATDWCGRQASALHRLGTEPEKRAAFAEAHNAVQEIARAALGDAP